MESNSTVCQSGNSFQVFFVRGIHVNPHVIVISLLFPFLRRLSVLTFFKDAQKACFAGEIKGFYQISLGNEVDFMDIIYISLYILAKN